MPMIGGTGVFSIQPSLALTTARRLWGQEENPSASSSFFSLLHYSSPTFGRRIYGIYSMWSHVNNVCQEGRNGVSVPDSA